MAYRETQNPMVRLGSYAALVLAAAITCGVLSAAYPVLWYIFGPTETRQQRQRATDRLLADTTEAGGRRFRYGFAAGAFLGVGWIVYYRITHPKRNDATSMSQHD